MKNYPYLLGATDQSYRNCALNNKNLFKDEESYLKFEKYVMKQILLVEKMEADYSAKHPSLYP